ncbi:MAG: response regulator [Bacteroidota bacterium]
MTSTKKILLVDDDKITNFVNEKLITNLDIPIFIKTCFSGVCALEYLNELLNNNESGPNIILLDINMPIMNGFEFLTELELLPKDFTQAIKVVMLSSTLNEEDKKRAFKFKNVVDFLNKPLSIAKIKELITQLL